MHDARACPLALRQPCNSSSSRAPTFHLHPTWHSPIACSTLYSTDRLLTVHYHVVTVVNSKSYAAVNCSQFDLSV